MESSGAAEPSSGYATPRVGGSDAGGTDEVWLRGNVRPVIGIGSLVLAGAALAMAVAVLAGAGPAVTGTLAAATAVAAAVVAALAVAAAGPRLARRGDALVVRLAPWRTEAVPFGVVECVFPGSQPLAGPAMPPAHAGDESVPSSGRRVGTLVIRFAERAADWRERPTFAPWGTWHEGHAIVDGRWCEPLSGEVARTIGQRLLDAKRAAATGTRP